MDNDKRDQRSGPDLHRPLDKQEIQEPNEGDPEARELGHLVGQTAEAQPGVFDTGAPSMIDGKRPGPTRLDPNAVQGPGGDSRPDLIDPSTAQFRLADNDSMMTTTRENLPPPDRALAEEMAKGRSDDDTIVVAKPHKGPLDKEIADLEHSAQKLKEPKEPLDR